MPLLWDLIEATIKGKRQLLLQFLLQLVQAGEHGWVHQMSRSDRLTLALDLVVVRADRDAGPGV